MGHGQANPLGGRGAGWRRLSARGRARRATASAGANLPLSGCLFGRFGDRLILRLRHGPEVWLYRLPAAWEFLARLFVGQRGDDDALLALLPVHWRGDRMLRRELDRVEE